MRCVRFTHSRTAAHPGAYRKSCSIAPVWRSAYYDWVDREENARAGLDRALAPRIRQVYEADRETRSTPHIRKDLVQSGETVGEKASPLSYGKYITADI